MTQPPGGIQAGDCFEVVRPGPPPTLYVVQAFSPAAAVTTPLVLTDAAAIVWDASLSSTYRVTLAGNRMLTAPSNMVPGRDYTLSVYQDATGSRTLAFAAAYTFPNGIRPVLTTTPGAVDLFSFKYDGVTLMCAGNKAFG